jgi:hypothetical protein
VIATAVIGISPSARAGYQPVADLPTTRIRLDAGPEAGAGLPALSQPWVAPAKYPPKGPLPQSLHEVPTGSTTPPQSGGGGSGPSVGYVPPADVPPAVPVVFARAFADRFDLSAFVTSILDPPRSR